MMFRVPPRKEEKLMALLDNILTANSASSRELSRVAGLLASMHLAIGPLVRFMSRYTYFDYHEVVAWDAKFTPSTACITELRYWKENFADFNGYPIRVVRPDYDVLFTDASDIGYGAHFMNRSISTFCHGPLPPSAHGSSSTYRELIAVRNSLLEFGSSIHHKRINIRTDNWAVAHILSVGSSKPHLHDLALQIHRICQGASTFIIPS